MEYCEKGMTITFYFIFFGNIIVEIAFLFEVPYYHFSTLLQFIKIMRILLGIINLLINLYFLVLKYAENLIKKEEKEVVPLKHFHYSLLDKILIIVAFIISLISFCFSFAAIILTHKYLNKKEGTFLDNSYYIDSIYFLIENILTTLCWLFFLIYWAATIQRFMNPHKNIIKKKQQKGNNVPPLPSQIQPPSSGRKIKGVQE